MLISVTQQHIDRGRRASCSEDAVALALKDAGFRCPWVSPDHIAWRNENKDYCVDTPSAVLAFLKIYDNGGAVLPFSFEMEGL